jgi:uncharacterized protein with HEPN domain
MNPKTRKLLEQILMFAKRTKKRISNITLEAFLNDEYLQDAVLYCLGQMGETASRVPDDEQEKYPDVFWNQMIGLRHRVFHDYEALNLSIVYEITQEPTEQLIQNLEALLK